MSGSAGQPFRVAPFFFGPAPSRPSARHPPLSDRGPLPDRHARGITPVLTLGLAIALVVLATGRWRVHPFLALITAAIGYGLANGLSPRATLEVVTSGFGRTAGAIGVVIAGGCVIGTVMERTGAALVLANAVLRLVGATRSLLAMTLTGGVVSVPVFCDSGYVVLAPLARSLAWRTGRGVAGFAVALSLGLYTTHCLVPPTPGPVAAAGELRADLGRVIGLGLLVAAPVLGCVWLYATRIARRWPAGGEQGAEQRTVAEVRAGTSIGGTLAPIVVPVLLISVRSFVGPLAPAWLVLLGEPTVALLVGTFLALALAWRQGRQHLGAWTSEALAVAGPIVLITAAGGALGSVLRATPLADLIAGWLAAGNWGAFNLALPFLVAAALKTAQGSSTVAIVTTASLVSPVLPALGLDGANLAALTALAIGAGSMVVSHVNDSYFWVVTQLSGLTVAQGYRILTVGSALAGGVALAGVLALGWVLG